MTADWRIERARSEDDFREAASLLLEYERSLPVALDYQDFGSELADLEQKYATAGGALLIARDDGGQALGCIAMRPLHKQVCEMKRLFIRPAGRSRGLGRKMALAIIAEAKRAGFEEMVLDTLPSMQTAMGLYEMLGFRPIAPYYTPTPPGTVFMSLSLRDDLRGGGAGSGEHGQMIDVEGNDT